MSEVLSPNRRGDPCRSKEGWSKLVELKRQGKVRHIGVSKIGYPYNVTAGVVAIAWTLKNPAVTAAIVGSRSPAQIEEMVIASEFRLSDSEARQIETFLVEHP